MKLFKPLLISTFSAAVMLLFGGITEVNGDPLAMAFLSHKAKTNRVIEVERINLPFWKFCPSPSVKKFLAKIIKKADHWLAK